MSDTRRIVNIANSFIDQERKRIARRSIVIDLNMKLNIIGKILSHIILERKRQGFKGEAGNVKETMMTVRFAKMKGGRLGAQSMNAELHGKGAETEARRKIEADM